MAITARRTVEQEAGHLVGGVTMSALLAASILAAKRVKQAQVIVPAPLRPAPIGYVSCPLFSAVMIGNGAEGQITLFTVPQGQSLIGWCGSRGMANWRIYDETLTSMVKAGELGSYFGDVLIYGIKFDFPEGVAKINIPEFNRLGLGLKIAGKCVYETHLGDLPTQIEPIPCAMNDTLQVTLRAPYGYSLRLRGDPTIVRITLDAWRKERSEP